MRNARRQINQWPLVLTAMTEASTDHPQPGRDPEFIARTDTQPSKVIKPIAGTRLHGPPHRHHHGRPDTPPLAHGLSSPHCRLCRRPLIRRNQRSNPARPASFKLQSKRISDAGGAPLNSKDF
ncbi:hypothetical protein C0Q70_03779 [Pomacea canaliculata]|uniref:Uncharacterized protein n=1 Tax=Pomacea canaliculata TaxID=400727 RepID=A0A2T7PTP9_POMCA|nr:hypothetical protein C0Q70_03779 [Pomacea canaliculata]